MPHTVGLAEASRLTGKSQSTIHRAMKAGRISYTVEDGARQIDAAELMRVFGMKSNGAMGDSLSRPEQRQATQGGDSLSLQGVIDAQAETIRDLRTARDDLCARLDAEREERRQIQAQLTALLTDQRPASPPATAWGRFLAWRRGR